MLWALRPKLPILNDGGVPMWLTVCVLTIALAIGWGARKLRWGTTRTALRKLKDADVCFGSKADICSARRNVRFTPESECN